MTKYRALVDNISEILTQGRNQAARTVNHILVQTYWRIGKQIVEFEQNGKLKAEYGSSLLVRISQDLKRYGKGFSIDNLERMRKIYIQFPKSATVSRKLSWSHYSLLIRVKSTLPRKFYHIETQRQGWSTRELQRQIDSMLFERLALSKNKKEILRLAYKGQIIEKPQDIIKEPYVLDFLDLQQLPQYTESELEQRIIDRMEKFLLELGTGFMFVERQKRLILENDSYYIDLVFYHRLLRCFVLIELKIGRLTHGDLGQLQMYVNYYDREVRTKEEKPTIGILLCADKKEAIVRYTLPEDNKQIFAAEYKLYLPKQDELQKRLQELLV
jgi:predicted nuclease of restriction endonuclease-like (RecB) superfamily